MPGIILGYFFIYTIIFITAAETYIKSRRVTEQAQISEVTFPGFHGEVMAELGHF